MKVKVMFRKFEPEGLGVAFFATGPGLGLIMYILRTLEFPKHNFDFHLLTFGLTGWALKCISFSHSNLLYFKKIYLLTTSVNAKYYL